MCTVKVLRELLVKLQNEQKTPNREYCEVKLKTYFELISGAKNGHIKGCKPVDGTLEDVVDTCRCHFQLHVYPKKLLKEIISVLIGGHLANRVD